MSKNPTPIDRPTATESAELIAGRMNRVDRAKRTYDIYAHRCVSDPPPWERLSADEQAAWLEIVDDFYEDPTCSQCGDPIYCFDCQRIEICELVDETLRKK